MFETIESEIEVAEQPSVAPSGNLPDRTRMFRLAFNLYHRRPLDDSLHDYLDSLAGAPSIVLLTRGQEYLHPAEFNMLPAGMVRESIIENPTAVSQRRLETGYDVSAESPQLYATLLGTDCRGEELSLAILAPGGKPEERQYDRNLYPLMTRLADFFRELRNVKAIADFYTRPDTYNFIIDLDSRAPLIGSCPSGKETHDCSRNNFRRKVEDSLNKLFSRGFENLESDPFDKEFRNIEISRFRIQKHDYAMVAYHLMSSPVTAEMSPEPLLQGFIHRLNNKLGAMQTAADQLLLEKGRTIDDDDIALTEIIRHQSQFIEKMVQRLNQYCHCGRAETTVTDLMQIVRHAVAMIQTPGNAPRQIEFSGEENGPMVEADAVQLTAAFAEILDNACLHGKGLTIGIDQKDTIRVSIRNRIDKSLKPPKELKISEMLEPFTTTEGERVGLGLSIAEKIITAHGGRLEILIEENNNFEARVILPVIKPGRV